jgi:hypothetical protein
LNALAKDLNGKIDAAAKDLNKIQLGLIVIVCLTLAQMLPSILTFLK